MDGALVNSTISASIDNANRSGNIHQYFTKSLSIIITIYIPINLCTVSGNIINAASPQHFILLLYIYIIIRCL